MVCCVIDNSSLIGGYSNDVILAGHGGVCLKSSYLEALSIVQYLLDKAI